ncbi:PKD domain-containing protein [Paenimyroides baculatum]|uniref:PKD domain-containing protein n=1 Tax=Paenimyroides baculatum TaxID=2608000 RepID=A0A5M6CRD0_9FLAO|nr:PKD domain-containing protein [Paenimyroides baculatum]KAA5535729.1 PKD domain-containing protein [Paenimyroides baculatum]
MRIIGFFSIVILFITACSKDESEHVADCFGQSLFANVHHEISNENSKTVNLNVTYSSTTHTLKNTIKWNYGDGITETVTGTSTSHTYAKAGSYTVIASVSLVDPNCTFDIKESVVVQ